MTTRKSRAVTPRKPAQPPKPAAKKERPASPATPEPSVRAKGRDSCATPEPAPEAKKAVKRPVKAPVSVTAGKGRSPKKNAAKGRETRATGPSGRPLPAGIPSLAGPPAKILPLNPAGNSREIGHTCLPGEKKNPPAARRRPDALTVEQVAAILANSGAESVTPADVSALVAAGCPVNADGTINLVALGAWLIREESHVKT